MVAQKSTAREKARWHEGTVWLDHSTLELSDLDWLGRAHGATFWNVRVPNAFFSRWPTLTTLDVRGGSGSDVGFLAGALSLRALTVNQIRGVTDLGAIGALHDLESLTLYGLPHVTTLPPLSELTRLTSIRLGSLKGLTGVASLLDAKNLKELRFHKMVAVSDGDAAALGRHPSLGRFEWNGEDVPHRMWAPFTQEVTESLLAR